MKMKMLNTMAMVIAGGAMLLATSGCDKSQQDNLKEQATDAQRRAGDAANDAMAQAKAGWESLKTQYAPQIDAMNEKVATLKTEAAKFKDTQLDGYIAQIDEKLSNVKGKLSETFSSEGFATLKDNVGQWMDDVRQLYDKASARLAELVKGTTAPAPAGSTTPGG